MNRSNMNMQMTRGDKMDDEKKEGSKKKMARGGMAKKKMARGGMTEAKKMKRGGKVKGSGCATKGTRKAKIR